MGGGGGDSWSPTTSPCLHHAQLQVVLGRDRLSESFCARHLSECWWWGGKWEQRNSSPGSALDVADQMFRCSRVISQPAVWPPGSAVIRPTWGDFPAAAGPCWRGWNPQNCRDRVLWHGRGAVWFYNFINSPGQELGSYMLSSQEAEGTFIPSTTAFKLILVLFFQVCIFLYTPVKQFFININHKISVFKSPFTASRRHIGFRLFDCCVHAIRREMRPCKWPGECVRRWSRQKKKKGGFNDFWGIHWRERQIIDRKHE